MNNDARHNFEYANSRNRQPNKRKPIFSAMLAAAFMCTGAGALSPTAAHGQSTLTTQQKADKLIESHLASIGKRAHKQFYDPNRWDLGDIPVYKPEEQVKGVIRIGLAKYLRKGTVMTQWEEAFKKYHPGITFEHSDQTLSTGLVDIVQQRGYDFGEWQQAMLEQGVFPLEIEMATGAYNVPGWTPALAIFVNKSNPVEGLSLKQLDGIFGGPRAGGWDRIVWNPAVARGKEGNIRTWGQAGLGGEWANREISVNGRPLKYHIQLYFERKVFNGGSIWNENVREWPHVLQEDGTRALSSVSMVGAVAKDPAGIVYADLGSDMPEVKLLPISKTDGGPFVPLTLDTLHDRTYPLFMEIYLYAQRPKGKPVDPKVREFLRFVLSREGQQAVQNDAKWIPLQKSTIDAQLKKVDETAQASPVKGEGG